MRHFYWSSLSLGIFLLVCFCTGSVVAQEPGEECVQSPPGAVAWWSFDETSGVLVADRIGDHHGTLTNGPTTGTGKVRGAVVLDGGNDYVVVPDDPMWAFGSRNFTIELWAMLNSPGGSIGHPGDIFVGNDEGPGTRRKWFFALGGGRLNFHVNGPGIGAQFFPQVPFSPQAGQWYHLALVRRGNTYTIFIDGEPRGAAERTFAIPDVNAPLTIGQAENLGYLNGRLDELTIYDRALEDQEISAIHNAGKAGKCIDLAIYPVQGGVGGSVTIRITGSRFPEGVEVELIGVGVGSGTEVSNNGTTIYTSFNLEDASPGFYDIIVRYSDGFTIEQSDAFEIIEIGSVDLWCEIVGMNMIRAGSEQTVWFTYGNDGTMDAWGAVAFLAVPPGLEFRLGSESGFASFDENSVVPVLVSKLGTGRTGSVPLRIRAPSSGSISLGTAISQSFGNILDLADGYEAIPSDLAKTIKWTTRSDPASWDPSRFDSNSIVGPGEPGQPGYIHWFMITKPGGGHEQETSILLPKENIGWSLPGFGVDERPFAATGKYVGKDGLTYYYQHLFGIQPLPDAGMPDLQNNLYERFLQFDDYGYCNPGQGMVCDPENTVSCLGLVRQIVYPGGLPQDMLHPCPPPTPGECYDTSTLMQYLFEQAGLDLWDTISTFSGFALSPEAYAFLMDIIGSWDPNEKAGPQGAGDSRYVADSQAVNYTILFENLSSASAPALEIVISDTLDTNLDANSLNLGPITFGSHTVNPSGASSYYTEYDLRPANNLLVCVNANFDPNTRRLSWRLTGIDPDTGQMPTDPLAGFLPPNTSPPDGEGAVLFSVLPIANLPTGTELRNRAEIIFDYNPPIETTEWVNTIDGDDPSSSVGALDAEQSETSFLVAWNGSDVGAGVRDYDIHYSKDGSGYQIWKHAATETEAMFTGVPGSEYAFYSVARDHSGNREAVPLDPDATTIIIGTGVDPYLVVGTMEFDSDEPPTYPYIGMELTISVPVKNRSELEAIATVLFEYVNDVGERVSIDSVDVTVPPHLGGEDGEVLAESSWIVANVNTMVHCSLVDVVPFDLDESNNTAHRQLTDTTVATLLSEFTVAESGGGVRISWRVHQVSNGLAFQLVARQEDREWEIHVHRGDDGLYYGLDDTQNLDRSGKVYFSLYIVGVNGQMDLLGEKEFLPESRPLPTGLTGAHPNPFNPTTTISFSVAHSQRIELAVYDMKGRRIALLADTEFGAGSHTLIWRGVDVSGRSASSGTYLVRLRTEQRTYTEKILLMR